MSERQAQPRPPARPHPESALGIDVGSTNTKVVLISAGHGAGAELARSSFPTPDDPAALVGRAEDAIRGLLQRVPSRPVAVGIASMAETGVPLDEHGEPVGSFVRWNRVGASEPSALAERLGAAALFDATGVPPLRKAPLLVLEALRHAEPGRWARLASWSGAGDLITQALTGRLVTDHTLAGRTLAYRLPGGGQALPQTFDAELLGEIGLRPEQLPSVATPGEPAGTVTAAAAARTGLVAGTPVVVAGHDHAVGAWGSGARGPGQRADSVGTSEALLRLSGSAIDRQAAGTAGMSITRSVSGDLETLLAGSPAGGSLIAALLRGDLGGTPLDPADVFAAPIVWPSAFALPYPLGRQCPAPDPEARLRFADPAGRPVDPGSLDGRALAAAVLLGLSLQLRWMRDEQERITGEPPNGILRMVGGAAADGNAAWTRLRADVLAEPLEPVASAEPVAAAAALLAAVRTGAADPDAALPSEAPTTPSARHDDAFAVFIAAAAARPLTPA